MELFSLDRIWNYGGSGFIWIVWIAAIIYLIIKEKKKHIRLMLIWTSIAGLVLFMCPLSKWIYTTVLGEATYYRFLWTIPIGIVIAYALGKAFLNHRVIGFVLGCLLIMLTGKKIYESQYFSITSNPYQLPDQLVELCDAIHPEYYEVRACFPVEFIHQVPQYDASIQLAFGREVLVASWGEVYSPIYEAQKEEILDTQLITQLCVENEVEYYIISKDRKMTEAFEVYDWENIHETSHYRIYKQKAVASPWEKVQEWLKTDESMTNEEKAEWLESQGIVWDGYLER